MAVQLTRNRFIVIGLVLGTVLVWFVVDLLWQTDSERINHILDQLAEAAAAADANAVMAVIPPEYADEDVSRDELAGWVHAYFKVYGATSVTYLQRGSITVTGNRAVMEVVVLARSDPHGGRGAYVAGRSRWRLSFRKAGDQWGIVKVEPLAFEGRQLNGWRDAVRQM